MKLIVSIVQVALCDFERVSHVRSPEMAMDTPSNLSDSCGAADASAASDG